MMLTDGIKERMRAAIFNTAIAPRPGEDWRDALRRQVAVTRPAHILNYEQRRAWQRQDEAIERGTQRLHDMLNRPAAEQSGLPIVRVLDLQQKGGA